MRTRIRGGCGRLATRRVASIPSTSASARPSRSRPAPGRHRRRPRRRRRRPRPPPVCRPHRARSSAGRPGPAAGRRRGRPGSRRSFLDRIGQVGRHHEAAAVVRPGVDPTADHRYPLPGAEQALPRPSFRAVSEATADGEPPSSCTRTLSVSVPRTTSTCALACGPACLITLVSASWMIRYAERSTPGGTAPHPGP